ncbi:3464_t:CDS:10 [Cetraspora pellucida]|uniref:3464_t:CDS:1 n=1 Tax=Cetraspora pellucida TaxID=1433469 RepID=A0A9N8VQ85_9GLOM|nr:3464_t:CDS:10 [Cetraspora pellucida]
MSINIDLAAEFKVSLLNALQSREKSGQRFKNDKIIEKKDDFELVLDTSDEITKLVQEFFKASLAVGNTGELVNYIISLLTISPTWERITLILSIFNGLITDTPTTFGLLLALGGDISQQSSTLQPVMHITIPQIFKDIEVLIDISSPELWMGVLSFMRTILQQNPRAMMDIPPDLATDIIKIILQQIERLPIDLDKQKYKCVEKGRQIIETFLIGKDCGGTGCVSHYQVIGQLQAVYGMPVLGRFISVHWSMEQFVNELCQRRKRLAFLMMPPGFAFVSRSHEYIDITHLPIYQIFSCDYQFIDEGHVTKCSSRFRDLLFQRASFEEFKTMIKSVKQNPQGMEHMRTAFFDKVHNVIKSIQSQSNFEQPRIDQHSNEDMLIPENLGFWELIIELGDQLVGLVAADHLKYEEVLSNFYYMVHPKHGERHNTVPKDNTLIWLLIPLFYLDKIGTTISGELKFDERLLNMLIQLYNEQQIRSKDSFYLRDLALQCVVTSQKAAIRDVPNIKHRYPQLTAALSYMPHSINKDFENYKANVVNHDIFRNLTIQEIIKLSIASQMNKSAVADTLYAYLVPGRLEAGQLGFGRLEAGQLGFADAKFLKGGIIEYKLLDLINVTSKLRLVEFIYKMMLDGDVAPKFPIDVTEHKITCVSPYVLDVLYKTVYSAPWSLETLVKEILDKLKRFDKASKVRAEGGTQLTETALRWEHTILQLFCHRFHRFLKHSAKTPDLLHYIKHSVSYLEHRQTYRDAELFALHIMMMQTDVKFIKSLSDSNREKQILFAESELLARYMIYTMARVEDIPDIMSVILEIYPHPIQWSDTTLSFFPEPLRTQLAAQQMAIEMPVSSISFTDKDMNSALQVGNLFKLFMDQSLNSEDEVTLQEHYSKLENQPIFLCSLWKIGCGGRKILNPEMMSTLRKVLLQFPPSRMATYTMTLIDFIIEMIERDLSPVDVCYKMLDELIWKYQILAFEHVIFALVKGNCEINTTAIGILNYLLFKSEEFSGRVGYFISLKFSHRYWTEDDHHDKLMKYLEKYPEYFQYEAFAMNDYKTVLEPPLATNMPIYYTTAIRRSLPILDIVIGRLIEFEQQKMLADLLDKYRLLYRYHQTPLAFVRDLLHYYYSAPVLRDQSISTRLIKLLDFDEYDIDSQLLQYGAGSNDVFLAELFDITYFEKVFHKLADLMSPDTCAPKVDAKFPERHFREIPNPVVQALHIACIEVLATPISPEEIVKESLDIVTSMNGRKNTSVQPMVMHAMGFLYSFLPTEEFLYQIFDKIVLTITTDPHLKEFSQPFNLIQREQSQPSLPYLDLSYQSNPLQQLFLPSTRDFSAMFPYIFNEYASNIHNFGTNVANSLLTFTHCLLHYSNIDDIQIFIHRLLNIEIDGIATIATDVQILYLCALVGPVIHRLLENHTLTAKYPEQMPENTFSQELDTPHHLPARNEKKSVNNEVRHHNRVLHPEEQSHPEWNTTNLLNLQQSDNIIH